MFYIIFNYKFIQNVFFFERNSCCVSQKWRELLRLSTYDSLGPWNAGITNLIIATSEGEFWMVRNHFYFILRQNNASYHISCLTSNCMSTPSNELMNDLTYSAYLTPNDNFLYSNVKNKLFYFSLRIPATPLYYVSNDNRTDRGIFFKERLCARLRSTSRIRKKFYNISFLCCKNAIKKIFLRS